MQTDSLLEKIFNHSQFQQYPPVLLDIGASGELHAIWKPIAKYATCIAFDADDREFDANDSNSHPYKKLHLINKIATDSDEETATFYLTKSPYCSSLLKPDLKNLARWQFADIFEVEKTVTLKSVSVKKALKDLGIDYVDWFKSDSQGIDLRLFKNLGQMQDSVIVADFEPGLIDAYIDEDKIKDVLGYMNDRPFWLTTIVANGNYRADMATLKRYFNEVELQQLFAQTPGTPIYADMSYFNDFASAEMQTERNYLLGCAFGLLLKQYAFTAELALCGLAISGDTIFGDILKYTKQISTKPTMITLIKEPALLKKKVANRLISFLQKLN